LHLGRHEEAKEAFDAILQEEEAESSATITLQEAMFIAPEPTVRMAEAALAAHPEWSGVEKILTAARDKYEQEAKANLRQDGLAAVERGDFTQAADLLSQGARINPTDAETLLGLAKALLEKGERQEAIPLLFKGLNAHPGHHWAYMVLAEDELAAGNYQGAAALLQRLQSLSPNRPEIVKRLEVCQRRLREQPPLPSVAQKPPKLIIFLVGGLTPKMVQAAAPHFLMGRAWGELLGGYNPEARDLPGWGSIYTCRPPVEHGIEQDFINGRMACLDDLKLTSLWDLLARDLRLGLMSIPLGCPPPKQAAWSVAGFPGGLLDRSLVHPPELTPLVLSEGYRTDLLLTENDQQGYCIQLEKDFRQEALLYQTERHRLGTAMAMPAVDVLAIGFNLLERVQHCFGLEPSMYRTGAFQQLYAILETTLAALLPENFAIIGQRSYESEAGELTPEGFYCLSWLKGENGKARAETLVPEILKLMGVNPAPLGKPLS
jgi:Flp pilus assembly protein TadD